MRQGVRNAIIHDQERRREASLAVGSLGAGRRVRGAAKAQDEGGGDVSRDAAAAAAEPHFPAVASGTGLRTVLSRAFPGEQYRRSHVSRRGQRRHWRRGRTFGTWSISSFAQATACAASACSRPTAPGATAAAPAAPVAEEAAAAEAPTPPSSESTAALSDSIGNAVVKQ